MFFRFKKSGERSYVQIVENKRIDGAVRQSVTPILLCRRAPSKPRRQRLRHHRYPSENAAAAPSVVPRRREFRRSSYEIIYL
jgi:hypothetical protein